MPEGSTSYPILFSIDGPDQIRNLDQDQLDQLVVELRKYLIEITDLREYGINISIFNHSSPLY